MAGNMWRRTWGAGPRSRCSLPRRQQEPGSAGNPLICIQLDLKAKCKIQPSFLRASHSLLKNHQTFRWNVHRRTSDSPRLVSSQEWSQKRYNPRKVFVILFMDIGLDSSATFLHRLFLFIHLCQLEFSAACFTLIKLDQDIYIFLLSVDWYQLIFVNEGKPWNINIPHCSLKNSTDFECTDGIIPGDYRRF